MQKILVITLFLFIFAGCSNNKDISNETAKNHQMPDGSIMHGEKHVMAKIVSQEQFLNEMIPHHQEAVDTSNLLLKSTTNPELKNFLNAVVEVQTKEIADMKSWLKDWYGKEYQTNTNYMPMMGDLASLSGKMQELAYVNGMIVHHQGAIQMAQEVLALTNLKPEIKTMAEAIIEVQSAEIVMLEELLQKL